MARGEGASRASAAITPVARRGMRGQAATLAREVARPVEMIGRIDRHTHNPTPLKDRTAPEAVIKAQSDALSRFMHGQPARQVALIRSIRKLEEFVEAHASSKAASTQQLVHQAREAAERGRELFVMCHNGFIKTETDKHAGRFDHADREAALETLRQEARLGVNRSINTYDEEKGGNPLTYAKNWIMAYIKEAVEREGRTIRVKSESNDELNRMDIAAKKFESEGRSYTPEELAAAANVRPDSAKMLAPFVKRSVVYGGDMANFGWIPGPDEQNPELAVLDEETKQILREEVAKLRSPAQRCVLGLVYGLDGEEPVEQKDLFDGVYRDKQGKLFSAEDSIIKREAAAGRAIEKRAQKELNQLYAEGALEFEPRTGYARELALMSLDPLVSDYDRPAAEAITRETGIPLTSGQIQEMKLKAESALAQSPRLAALAPRYRGENELENSEAARREVQDSLARMGVVGRKEAERLKANGARNQKGSSRSDKGPLRVLAEQHGLVDGSGRLDYGRIMALREGRSNGNGRSGLESTSELADLMSQA